MTTIKERRERRRNLLIIGVAFIAFASIQTIGGIVAARHGYYPLTAALIFTATSSWVLGFAAIAKRKRI